MVPRYQHCYRGPDGGAEHTSRGGMLSVRQLTRDIRVVSLSSTAPIKMILFSHIVLACKSVLLPES